jgi:hypothetical protein
MIRELQAKLAEAASTAQRATDELGLAQSGRVAAEGTYLPGCEIVSQRCSLAHVPDANVGLSKRTVELETALAGARAEIEVNEKQCMTTRTGALTASDTELAVQAPVVRQRQWCRRHRSAARSGNRTQLEDWNPDCGTWHPRTCTLSFSVEVSGRSDRGHRRRLSARRVHCGPKQHAWRRNFPRRST